MQAPLYSNEARVDRLGQIKKEIAALKKEAAIHSGALKEQGLEHVEGYRYRADITYLIFRHTVDWKKVAIEAEIPQEIIDRNTRSRTEERVTITAR